MEQNEITVEQGPSGRWYWRVGAHSGEEQTKDAAYDRARDIQRQTQKFGVLNNTFPAFVKNLENLLRD